MSNIIQTIEGLDLQALGNRFKDIGQQASGLYTQLKAVNALQGLTPQQKGTLDTLARLASDAQTQIAPAVHKARQVRIDVLATQIAQLQSTLLLDLSPPTLDSVERRIDVLSAERADLLTRDASDYSDVVGPDDIAHLVALLAAADQDIQDRQRFAAAIPILLTVVDLAAKIGAAIAML